MLDVTERWCLDVVKSCELITTKAINLFWDNRILQTSPTSTHSKESNEKSSSINNTDQRKYYLKSFNMDRWELFTCNGNIDMCTFNQTYAYAITPLCRLPIVLQVCNLDDSNL